MKEVLSIDGYSKSLYQIEPEVILSQELGKKYIEYRKRWHKAREFKIRPPFPIHLNIELSYACNLRCVMCPFGDPTFKHPYKGIKLDIKRVKEVLKEGVKKGLSSVTFCQLNEPLLENSLAGLIRFAKRIGVLDIFITTNGMLLTEKKSFELIKAGTTHLLVSIDAASEETYSKIRIGGDYKRVVTNVLNFLRIRSELGSRLPLVRVTFVKMKPNMHEIDEFIKMWSGKVDYVTIAGYLKIINNEETHNKLKGALRTTENMQSFSCWQPWSRCNIFANGDVFPCCMNHGRNAPVGNIFKDELSNIWKSKAVRFIQDINKAGEYYKHPVCKKCVSVRDIF